MEPGVSHRMGPGTWQGLGKISWGPLPTLAKPTSLGLGLSRPLSCRPMVPLLLHTFFVSLAPCCLR